MSYSDRGGPPDKLWRNTLESGSDKIPIITQRCKTSLGNESFNSKLKLYLIL